MKVANILALILSILLIGVSLYYIEENLTLEGGLVTFPFFLFFGAIFIANIVKLKRAKAISIIGIIFTVFMMAWDAAMMDSPSHISFDEVGVAWLGYAVICIIFFSVLLSKSTVTNNDSIDILDDAMIE